MLVRKWSSRAFTKKRLFTLICFALCASFVPLSVVAQTGNGVVEGLVTAIAEQEAVVAGAEVIFKDVDIAVRTKTDYRGRYRASLDPTRSYTVLIQAEGLCAVHRPAFRPTARKTVTLNFTLVVCGNVDPTEVDPSGEREMYREEVIRQSDSSASPVIVAFGRRRADSEIVNYSPFGVGERSLPVTISFDTTTIRADRASLDLKTDAIRLSGNVFLSDGLNAPQELSCVTLKLGKAHEMLPCKPTNED